MGVQNSLGHSSAFENQTVSGLRLGKNSHRRCPRRRRILVLWLLFGNVLFPVFIFICVIENTKNKTQPFSCLFLFFFHKVKIVDRL